MSSLFCFILALVPVCLLCFIAYRSFKSRMMGASSKKVLSKNLLSFAVILVLTAALMFTVSAADKKDAETAGGTEVSEEGGTAEPAGSDPAPADNSKGLGLLAAGLVTGLAGIGGGIAVAAGAPAAIAATSEDPKSFGKSLIFVALGESIALYGVVISILIINKV